MLCWYANNNLADEAVVLLLGSRHAWFWWCVDAVSSLQVFYVRRDQSWFAIERRLQDGCERLCVSPGGQIMWINTMCEWNQNSPFLGPVWSCDRNDDDRESKPKHFVCPTTATFPCFRNRGKFQDKSFPTCTFSCARAASETNVTTTWTELHYTEAAPRTNGSTIKNVLSPL